MNVVPMTILLNCHFLIITTNVCLAQSDEKPVADTDNSRHVFESQLKLNSPLKEILL